MWGGGGRKGNQLNLYGNPSVLNILWCTHDIPPHSLWYLSSVLMVSPPIMNSPAVLMISHTLIMISLRCSHGIPHCTEHPWCTHDSPSVLHTPGVLHRQYAGWFLTKQKEIRKYIT